MESENGGNLVNVSQEEENIKFVLSTRSSDGREDSQQASEHTSSGTSASIEKEKMLDGMYYSYLRHYRN